LTNGVVGIQQNLRALGLALLHLTFQPLDVLVELVKALHAGEHQVKLLAGEGLFQEVHRAPPHGLHGVFHTALRGKNDHRQIGLALEHPLQDVEAFFRPQIQIQQHRIESSFL